MGLYSVYVLLFAVAAGMCDHFHETNGSCMEGSAYQLPVNLAGAVTETPDLSGNVVVEAVMSEDESSELLEKASASTESDSDEERPGSKIPYTCAHVHADGRDLFLVATVHISPRAPKE
eukprot:Skav202517  [mRNA]  locus=scaffold1359:317615:321919:- [translate_table: standard]